jgi:threonine/homoserine/homoserine lactone efflux protein
VGPIGVLCIRRTLAHGLRSGLASGMGAATADALYGCVAGFGLSLISQFLIQGQFSFRLAGGCFLLYLGARTFLSRPASTASLTPRLNLAGDYLSTFFLTLTNPLTVLSFAAIFAGLGLGGSREGYGSAAMMVLGVFLGSGLWWLILSWGVARLRDRFSLRGFGWVNRISGLVILGFGAAALVSLIFSR